MSQNALSLKVLEAYTRDVGRGVARIDYDSMDTLNASTGDVIEIKGKRRTVAKCLPLYPSDEGKGIIRIDGLGRNNSGIAIGDTISVRKIKATAAEKVVVAPLEAIPPIDERYLADALESVPLIKGDNVMVPYFGGRLTFQVIGVTPAADAVLITQKTVFHIAEKGETLRGVPQVTYEDIGGIHNEIKKVREMIELPLRHPEIFEKLNGYTFDNDYCGSNRWRVGLGAVYLGLRIGNQKLFTAGNRHIEINLATIDKDGIFPAWARKGALALSYQRQLPEVLTLLAVAYETIGYDFYEHQLPHGKKIHQVYEALFDFIYHPEKLNKYAFARPNFVGVDVYAFDKLPLSEKWDREIIDPEVLATQSKGYVLRYRPDLEDKINYTERWDQKFGTWKDHIAVFVSISGLAIYEAANQNVSKIIEAEEKAAKEAEEKSAERIKAIIKKEKE